MMVDDTGIIEPAITGDGADRLGTSCSRRHLIDRDPLDSSFNANVGSNQSSPHVHYFPPSLYEAPSQEARLQIWGWRA